MKFAAFWIVALAVIAAAVLLGPGQGLREREKPLLFPDLPKHSESISKIRLRDWISETTLTRQNGTWVIENYDGFPALPAKVNSLIAGLVQLRKLAPKTTKPRLHHRLGLQGIDQKGSPSMQITLLDENDMALAELVIGISRKTPSANNKSGLYARLPDQNQSWLLEGLLDVSAQPTDWFETLLFDISSTQLRSVRIRHPDGDSYTLERTMLGQEDFEYRGDLPLGMKPVSSVIINRVKSLLQDFQTSGVRSAQSFTVPDDALDAHISAFNGLDIKLRVFLQDDIAWASFAISATADAEDEAKTFAEILQKSFNGWVFQIPQFKYDLISRRSAKLLREE
ncbi:MAG: DUF4340 domain-containing protein [Candidatus Eutrophobiaceae bacterium]